MSNLILWKDELCGLLDKLNENRGFYEDIDVDVIADMILTVYKDGYNNKLKKHSNADIAKYIDEVSAEINFLTQNLDVLITNELEVNNDELIVIAHALKDQIEVEAARYTYQKLTLNTLEEIKEKANQIEKLKEYAIEEIERTKMDIKDIQGTIMKEAVAITSIIVAIIGFLLTNAGILTAIGEGYFFDGNANVLRIVIQINASMVLGISVLMMIAAAFIHKSKSGDGLFISTAKFIIPAIMITVATATLFLLNNF